MYHFGQKETVNQFHILTLQHLFKLVADTWQTNSYAPCRLVIKKLAKMYNLTFGIPDYQYYPKQVICHHKTIPIHIPIQLKDKKCHQTGISAGLMCIQKIIFLPQTYG
jgi:uncharacterized short protein YbdD (DUF466 family)